MPFSSPKYKMAIRKFFEKSVPPSTQILDVGPGMGQYGHLLKDLGYTIDAVKRSDYTKSDTKSIVPLSEIKGITESQILNFKEKDIISTADFLDAEKDLLLSVKGIGEKTIDKIKQSIDDYIISKKEK